MLREFGLGYKVFLQLPSSRIYRLPFLLGDPSFCHISVWSVQQVTGRSLCISCGERDVPKHLKKGSKEKGTKIDKFSVLDYVAIQCSVHLIDLRKDPEKLDLQSRFLALCLICIRPCL